MNSYTRIKCVISGHHLLTDTAAQCLPWGPPLSKSMPPSLTLPCPLKACFRGCWPRLPPPARAQQCFCQAPNSSITLGGVKQQYGLLTSACACLSYSQVVQQPLQRMGWTRTNWVWAGHLPEWDPAAVETGVLGPALVGVEPLLQAEDLQPT